MDIQILHFHHTFTHSYFTIILLSHLASSIGLLYPTTMAKTTSLSTKSFAIPWSCLHSSESPTTVKPNHPIPYKTFVNAVKNVCDIPLSYLPKPCVKDDRLSFSIPEEEYLAGIEACKHNLYARVIWPKGLSALTVIALCDKLKILWKGLGH